MDGVSKDVPDPNDDPPAAAEYQLIVPVDAVAPKVTDPVPHREFEIVLVIVGMVLTTNAPETVLVTDPQYPLTMQ